MISYNLRQSLPWAGCANLRRRIFIGLPAIWHYPAHGNIRYSLPTLSAGCRRSRSTAMQIQFRKATLLNIRMRSIVRKPITYKYSPQPLQKNRCRPLTKGLIVNHILDNLSMSYCPIILIIIRYLNFISNTDKANESLKFS